MIVIRFFACWFALSVVAGVVAGRIIAAGSHRTVISPGSLQAMRFEPATDVLPAPSPAPAPSALAEIARLESMFNHPAYRGRRQVGP